MTRGCRRNPGAMWQQSVRDCTALLTMESRGKIARLAFPSWRLSRPSRSTAVYATAPDVDSNPQDPRGDVDDRLCAPLHSPSWNLRTSSHPVAQRRQWRRSSSAHRHAIEIPLASVRASLPACCPASLLADWQEGKQECPLARTRAGLLESKQGDNQASMPLCLAGASKFKEEK